MDDYDEDKWLDAIFTDAFFVESLYRMYRQHAQAIASIFASPLDSYTLTGIDSDKDRITLYYHDKTNDISGAVYLIPSGDGGWDYDQAVKLPTGASMYTLIPWLLSQFADIQSPGCQW